MKKPKLKLTHKQSDGIGNELRVYMVPENPWVLTVKLKVRFCKKAKTLGLIDRNSRVVFMKREQKKHLHRVSNSYGFNYMFLSEAKQFDNVVLRDETKEYVIPKSYIISEGEFLFFKEEGFEKQIFVTLDKLRNYCTKEKIS